MIKVGQKYRFINFKDHLEDLNGIIVKVIKKDNNCNLVEIVDKSLLDNYKWYFHNSIYENNWYRWIGEDYLQPLRKEKLKRLLK